LVAFLLLSDVAETDNYSKDSMFATLFVIILGSVFFLVPVTFVLKFRSVSRVVQGYVDRVLFVPKTAWTTASDKRKAGNFVSPALRDSRRSRDNSSFQPSFELTENNNPIIGASSPVNRSL
jgi:hypothetical protein